jgi:hypothetical protein
MASNALSRVAEPKGRLALRRLVAFAPVLISGGLVAVLWLRLEHQEAELERTRRELTTAVHAVEMKASNVRVVRERVASPVAQEFRVREDATERQAPPEVADPGEADEPLPEEHERVARGRFDHIQGIFAAQKASDFEPVRARTLEREVSPALAELVQQRKNIELGSLECRGRMCGVDVALDGGEDADLLERTVRQALMKHEGVLPLIHLVTYVGDRPGKHVGRLYFEWLPEDANTGVSSSH